jgi:hypothetical protein
MASGTITVDPGVIGSHNIPGGGFVANAYFFNIVDANIMFTNLDGIYPGAAPFVLDATSSNYAQGISPGSSDFQFLTSAGNSGDYLVLFLNPVYTDASEISISPGSLLGGSSAKLFDSVPFPPGGSRYRSATFGVTGSLSLVSPTPEPSTFALVAGFLLLAPLLVRSRGWYQVKKKGLA